MGFGGFLRVGKVVKPKIFSLNYDFKAYTLGFHKETVYSSEITPFVFLQNKRSKIS